MAAGQLKRKEPGSNEDLLLIRAMRDSNVPKVEDVKHRGLSALQSLELPRLAEVYSMHRPTRAKNRHFGVVTASSTRVAGKNVHAVQGESRMPTRSCNVVLDKCIQCSLQLNSSLPPCFRLIFSFPKYT